MGNDKKLILIKIGEEVFAMKSDALSRQQRISIESLLESLYDDYADEIEGMDCYSLCSWIQEKIKTEFDVVFETIGIDYEFNISVK